MKNFSGIEIIISDEDLNKVNVIYKLTFPNNKYYIGKTIQHLKSRLQAHCSRAFKSNNTYNTPKSQYIREFKTFTVEILYEGEELNNKEIEFINLFESYNSWCNLTLGGNSGLGYKPTEQTKQKISNSTKGKPKRKDFILQYSLDKNFLKEWESIAVISRELQIDPSDIGKCCKEKRKTAGGFIWKYKNIN